MDALFVVVAELLLIPLVLWGLIALDLTLGVVASLVSVALGRRSLEQAVSRTWRVVRRRLVWSMITLATGLLVADLLLFDGLVALALGQVDDDEQLELSYTEAEGSFLLGRIELQGLRLAGTRGPAGEPSARFEVGIDSLVIDIATAELLRARFSLQELSVEGVEGSVDRLRGAEAGASEPKGRGLSREFAIERLHFGQVELSLRDHTKASSEGPRELALELRELDIGPLRSNTALFDLLYRVRGSGSLAGVDFTLTSLERDGAPQSTLEVPRLPLALLGERIEAKTGVQLDGQASLRLRNRYREDPPEPRVELGLDLRLRELSLAPGEQANAATKLMLAVAARGLVRLGDDFPLHVERSVTQRELEGVRGLAESGIVELLADAIASALREELSRADAGEGEPRGGLLQRLRPGEQDPGELSP